VRETTAAADGPNLAAVRRSAPAPAFVSAPAAAPLLDSSIDYKDRLRQEMQRYERELIISALAAAEGNVTAAAQSLKIPVRTLTHKMQSLGIKKRFESEP